MVGCVALSVGRRIWFWKRQGTIIDNNWMHCLAVVAREKGQGLVDGTTRLDSGSAFPTSDILPADQRHTRLASWVPACRTHRRSRSAIHQSPTLCRTTRDRNKSFTLVASMYHFNFPSFLYTHTHARTRTAKVDHCSYSISQISDVLALQEILDTLTNNLRTWPKFTSHIISSPRSLPRKKTQNFRSAPS